MTIDFDFIGIVVRLDAIERKFPGGLKGCLDYCRKRRNDVYHDDHLLYGGGTMNARSVPDLISWWQIHGIETHRELDGKIVEWIDACVCERIGTVPLPGCRWLGRNSNGVYLAGTVPGKVVRRNPEPTEEEIAAAKKHAYEEVINAPFREARSRETARLQALGLPEHEVSKLMSEWITNYLLQHRLEIEAHFGIKVNIND